MYIESDISTWTVEDFDRNLAEVRCLFNSPRGTPAGDRLEVLLPLVGDYDDANYPIGEPTPKAAVNLHEAQAGDLIAA